MTARTATIDQDGPEDRGDDADDDLEQEPGRDEQDGDRDDLGEQTGGCEVLPCLQVAYAVLRGVRAASVVRLREVRETIGGLAGLATRRRARR